jgi:hypothetical protein
LGAWRGLVLAAAADVQARFPVDWQPGARPAAGSTVPVQQADASCRLRQLIARVSLVWQAPQQQLASSLACVLIRELYSTGQAGTAARVACVLRSPAAASNMRASWQHLNPRSRQQLLGIGSRSESQLLCNMHSTPCEMRSRQVAAACIAPARLGARAGGDRRLRCLRCRGCCRWPMRGRT